MERAQIPPPLRPFRPQSYKPLVENDSLRDSVTLTGGFCLFFQGVKAGRRRHLPASGSTAFALKRLTPRRRGRPLKRGAHGRNQHYQPHAAQSYHGLVGLAGGGLPPASSSSLISALF